MKLDPLTDPYLFYCILLYSTVLYCSLLDSIGFYAIPAGYPTILRNLGFWVRKLTILGFLADFTKGK